MADPRIDNGVRVSVDDIRGVLRAHAGTRDRFAAAGPVTAPDTRLGYRVSVYKVVPRPQSIERFFLFEKVWEVPACSTR